MNLRPGQRRLGLAVAQRRSRFSCAQLAIKDQIEKDAPQPQVVVALGLFTTKREPSKPSE